MPAIKKKWMKTNREDNPIRNDDSAKNESFEDEEKELKEPDSEQLVQKKPVKKSFQSQSVAMLKRLDGEVLLEKRKRFTPPAELKLSEWLDNNLEKRTEETIHLPLLYNYYTELCQADGSEILDVPEFNRMVKVKFGKTVGIQTTSIYKTLIKERKLNEKKKGGGGFKLKEILIEAINHFGNPWQGVRFFNLKQYVGTRCPAMQIDSKPKVLRRALEMGTRFGYIDLAKGIGMAGSYRLPGAVEPPPKPKIKAKKEDETEGDADTEEGDKPKDNKEENQENADGTEDESSKAKTESDKEEGPPKPKKAKKVQAWDYSRISFSNPSKVEDVFPLAITYQSAPKAAGVLRIRRYIQEKYGEEIPDHRWRKTVESGVGKGYWEHVSGSGITGSIHLLMDDFDPISEHLEDQICAAIIACHDPKIASANQIKKYVTQYHPDFGVEQRPDRFKKALLRAMDKKMIKQISGVGASGSFQLVVPFTPTPTVLAGDDDSEEEEENSNEVDSSYVPRGTKSRGMPKVKTMEVIQSKKPKKNSSSRKGRAGKKTYDSSDEEEEEEKPVRKRGKSSSKNQSQKRKKVQRKENNTTKSRKRRAPSPLTDEEEEEPEYTPQKSHSRGGGSSKQATPNKATLNKKKNVKPSPKTTKSSKKAADSESDEEKENLDSESEPEYTPRKSTSRGSVTPSQNGSRTPTKSVKKNHDVSVNDSPRKSTSKSGGGSSKGKSSGKKGRR